MQQTTRHTETVRLIADLEAGAALPTHLHHGARLYFPRALHEATKGLCIVCSVHLVGSQEVMCSGHWDWLQFEPLEQFEYDTNPRASIIEFLRVFLLSTFVLTRQHHWLAVIKEPTRCEVCGEVTANVEELFNGHGRVNKSHVVCPEHQTFRWEAETLI